MPDGLYQPTMMHVKAMVVAVGDRGLAARLLQDFEQDLKAATKLDLESWRRRSFLQKAREHFWSYFGEIF